VTHPVPVLTEAIGCLMRREDLSPELAERALASILGGDATDVQIAGFAVALRAKGETTSELAALARAMLHFAERVAVVGEGALVDTCGTGGDRAGTVNVSTMAALIAAGAGVRVAKHGNRAASSQCGSADVLDALGVVIDLPPASVVRCIQHAGIGFCFAPRFHPAMRFAATARRQLGVPTTFNVLGPLANPAGVRHQAVGVADPAMAERVVGALAELGTQHALVFYGHDGLDELTTTTTSTVFELREGEVRRYDVDPALLGLTRADPAALLGGNAAANAAAVRRVLDGDQGPVRDIAMLNAAAALVAADVVADLAEGIAAAASSLDGGKAAEALRALVDVSTECAA
jgi:anthranilate phosphoribosyltransferase